MGETGERATSRPLKAAVAGLALAGLLGLVALASNGAHPGGHARIHQREVPAQVTNDLLTIVVIVYAVALVLLVALAYALRGDWHAPRRRPWWQQVLVLLLVMGTITLLGFRLANTRFAERLHLPPAVTGRGGGHATPRPPTLPARPAPSRPAQLDWVLAAAIGGGLVLAAVVVLARRRERPERPDEETVEEELSAVVGDTIDDLRREADARRAVIAAYARMERVLAQHGHPRGHSEAPFEYLARVLLELRVRAAAVRDLTELFEQAKFSTHEIDRPMKERAIAALVSVRDDLEAVPA